MPPRTQLSFYVRFRFCCQRKNIFQLTQHRISITAPVIRIPLADGKLNVMRSVTERTLCHTQELCHRRNEEQIVFIPAMFLYITANICILVRGVVFDDLINGLLVFAVIIKDETFLIEAAFERNSACSKCDCYLLSLIRRQCNIFFITALIIVTEKENLFAHSSLSF